MRRSSKVVVTALGILFLSKVAWIMSTRSNSTMLTSADIPERPTQPSSWSNSPFSSDNGSAIRARTAAAPDSESASNKAEQIDRLSSSGDPVDAFKAYQLAAYCQRSREFLRMAVGAKEGEVKETCGNIRPLQIRERNRNLEKALKAGVTGSATEFAIEGPFDGDQWALVTRPDDPLVMEWKRRAIQQLTHAANRGDVSAMVNLVTSYDMGALTEKNPELALTYAAAMQEVRKLRGDMSPSQEKMGDKFVDVLSEGLSVEQRSAAIAAGKKMAADCCAKE